LSKKRAVIVARQHLNKIGEECIKKNQIKSKLKKISKNIFGNTLEAIIGAIFIDKGMKTAKKFVKKHIIESQYLVNFSENEYKGEVQKITQINNQKLEYRVIASKGPDHNKEYDVAIYIDGFKAGQEKGGSIKEAEQKAAKKVLKSVFLQQ